MTSNQQIVYLFPAAVAITGFLLARYIYVKKKRREKLVCLLDSDCDAVVHSRFSTFLGVPLEVFGIIYFLLTAIIFICAIFIPQLDSQLFQIIIPIATLAACLFSLYLASVQIFIIKQWCMWCLISTFLTALLFVSVILTSPLSIKSLIINLINKLTL